MKRFLPITALAVFAYPAATISCQNGQGAANPQIFWDGGAIPDPVFRTYVLENFDTDRDGKISRKEADAVLAIDLGRLCGESRNRITCRRRTFQKSQTAHMQRTCADRTRFVQKYGVEYTEMQR